MKKLFKKLAIYAICLMVGLSCVGLVACKNKKSSATNQIKSTSELYGFAALTTGMYLADTASASPSLASEDLYATEVVERVNHYIGILDGIVGGKSPIITQKQAVEESKANVYTSKIVVTTTDLSGNVKSYSIYLNETEIGNPQNKIHDPDNFGRSTSLNGVIVIGEQEIDIWGRKTVERGEVELEFVAFLGTEDNARVEFSQEFESGEQEYEYKLFNNNILTEEFSFEMEVKNNKVEVELETMVGGVMSSFEIEEISIKGVRFLEISYQEPGQREVKNIRVSISSNGGMETYTYKLPNGQTITK